MKQQLILCKKCTSYCRYVKGKYVCRNCFQNLTLSKNTVCRNSKNYLLDISKNI